MASALQVMAADEFWLLLKGNEGRDDVVRTMAADDYAEERMGGDELLAYKALAGCDAATLGGPHGAYYGAWRFCEPLAIWVALWREVDDGVGQGFLFAAAIRLVSPLAPGTTIQHSATLVGLARLVSQASGLLRRERGLLS